MLFINFNLGSEKKTLFTLTIALSKGWLEFSTECELYWNSVLKMNCSEFGTENKLFRILVLKTDWLEVSNENELF